MNAYHLCLITVEETTLNVTVVQVYHVSTKTIYKVFIAHG